MKTKEEKDERFINGIKCSQCKSVLVSLTRHDFQMCKCEGLFIDGGFDYCRLGGAVPFDWVKIKKPQLIKLLKGQKGFALGKLDPSKLADYYLDKAAKLRERESENEKMEKA